MVDRNNKETLLSIVKCALSTIHNSHICEEPIPLTCSHCVCKSCLTDTTTSVKCNVCQQVNERDLTQPIAANMFKYILDAHLDQILDIVHEEFDRKLQYFKNILSNSKETLDIKFEYVKEQIQIRIESLKAELDVLNVSLNETVDRIKKELDDEISSSNFDHVDIESMNRELAKMKNDISRKENLTVENLYSCQNSVKKLNALINELDAASTSIEFEPSTFHLKLNDIGEIISGHNDGEYINEQIIGRAKQHRWQNVSLEVIPRPDDMCVLPNGKLLSCDYKGGKLGLYENNLQFIKYIDLINGRQYNVISLDTNKRDSLYLSAFDQHSIVKTDLDFRSVSVFGGVPDTGPNYVSGPCGISHYDGCLYVCDYFNKRIQKLNEDLFQEESFPLRYSPWYIKVVNNLACIRSRSTSIIFHDIRTFNEIKKYDGHNGVIGASNSYFYEYYHQNGTLYCYNNKGELREQLETNLGGQSYSSNGSISIINSNLFICCRDIDVIKV